MTFAVEGQRAHQIPEPHRTAAEGRQANIALALICRVIDGHESLLTGLPGPHPRKATVPRPIALPRADAFEQAPLPVPQGCMRQHVEQAFVKLLHGFVRCFERRPYKMR